MKVSFAPLALSDGPRLTAWLRAPHVRAFWDDRERDEAAVRAHDFAPGRDAPAFVFYVDGVPVGFLQTYPVGPDAAFAAHAAPVGETWAWTC